MRWRLMLDPPGTAAHNMAVDETLYVSARGSERATVRLYAFDPPTVSLGYRQKLEEAIDEEACRRNGVDLVRRITGGGALLHQHELTWSLVAPTRVGAFRTLSVRDAYRRVNSVIRHACEALGVHLDPERDDTARARSRELEAGLPCLAAPSSHEITASGRKLVPSAQRRHRESLLQHGSVLFRVDEALWECIRSRSRSRSRPRPRPEADAPGLEAVGIEELLPAPPSREVLVDELRRSFASFFEEEGLVSGLDEVERRSVEKLERKYASRSHLLSADMLTTRKPFGKQ